MPTEIIILLSGSFVFIVGIIVLLIGAYGEIKEP